MSTLTIEDFKEITHSKILSTAEISAKIKEELDIDISPDLTPDEMAEEIFRVYSSAIKQIDKERSQVKKDLEKQNSDLRKTRKVGSRKSKKEEGASGGTSRKDFILGLIGENKYTKDEILELVAAEFNYEEAGRTPNTRVSKVIRGLAEEGKLIKGPDGILGIAE